MVKLSSIRMNKTKSLILTFILLLATFLRLYQLDSLPISLVGDEIDVGYQAWSLGTTGRDYTGHLLPSFLQSVSEWRTPLLSYILAPILAVFGPSTLAVRLPVALMGVLNIFLLYILFQKLFPKYKNYGLYAAFLLAISPWHIHFSRVAFDSTLLLNLYFSGFLLLLNNKLVYSLPIFILTFYTYPTANVFTPLILIAAFLILKPKIDLRKNFIVYLLSLALVIPFCLNMFNGSATGRFGGISILSDPKSTESIVTARTESWVVGHRLEQLFHNKPQLYLNIFLKQYVSAFSTNFLFVSGDPDFSHSIGEFGEFYLLLSPLLFIGFFSILSRLKDPHARLLLAWLILSPVPSALTQGGGSHAIRLIILLPALVILFTLALVDINSFITRSRLKIFVNVIFVFLCFISLIFYWHRYSDHYRYLSARNWQQGYEQIFKILPHIDNNSQNVYINNTYEPSLLKFLFYSKYPPEKFQKEFTGDVTQTSIIPGFDGFRLGNHIYFGTLQSGISLTEFLQAGDIYVAAQLKEIPGDQDWSKSTPQNLRILGVSYNVFGEPLFTAIEKE